MRAASVRVVGPRQAGAGVAKHVFLRTGATSGPTQSSVGMRPFRMAYNAAPARFDSPILM
jgi:hypothetical protein